MATIDLGRVVGKSAYEIAVDNGFEGTEQEWLDSMNYDDDIKSLQENKVDKVSGKELSTNDFTNTYKTKLDGLSNYDDTDLQNQITQEIADRKSADDDIKNLITSTVDLAIANVVNDAPEDFDTLKEMSDWISEHSEDASAMNSAILENKNAIANKADKSHTHSDLAKRSESAYRYVIANPAGGTIYARITLKVYTQMLTSCYSTKILFSAGLESNGAISNCIPLHYSGYGIQGWYSTVYTNKTRPLTLYLKITAWSDVEIISSNAITVERSETDFLASDFPDVAYKTISKFTKQLKDDDFNSYATKTALSDGLNNKVDKIEGKGLSTNDFTTDEKNKLDGLSNYDDTSLKTLINGKADSSHTHNNKTNYHQTSMVGMGFTKGSYIAIQDFWAKLYEKFGSNGVIKFNHVYAYAAYVGTEKENVYITGGTLIYTMSNKPSAWADFSALFVGGGTDNIYQIRCYFGQDMSTVYVSKINRVVKSNELTNWNCANTNYTYDVNDCGIGQWYSIYTNENSTNMPNKNGWANVITFAANNNSSYKQQLCFYNNENNIYTRTQINGTWGSWEKLAKTSEVANVNGSTADFQANTHFYKNLGRWNNYEQVVIPILEITSSINTNRYSNGKIFSHHDNGLYVDPIVEWKCNKMYNATASEKYNLVAYKLKHFKFATFEYEGKKYLGVLWNYVPSQPVYCYFDGYTNNNVSPMFTVIPYYNSNTKAVLNEEIKNSLTEVTDYEYGALATKSVGDKNGNDIVDTYATKAELEEIKKKNDELKSTIEEQTIYIGDLETENESLLARIRTLETENFGLQTENTNLQNSNQTLTNENLNLQSQITTLQIENNNLQSQITTLQSEITNLNIYIRQLEDQIRWG